MLLGRVAKLPVGLLVGAVCLASAARAQDNASKAPAVDDPILLSWTAPGDGDCPNAAYVLGEIRRYVGPARADRKPIRANAVIRAAGSGAWQMVLKTEQGNTQGERIFRDASCTAISDAAVVVLAWMIDPNAMSDQARPAAPAAPPSAPADVAPKAPASTPPARPREAIVPFVGIAVAGDAGTVPAAASGAEIRAGASMRPVRVSGYGAYWPSSSKAVSTLADGTPAGGTFSLLAVGLQGCFDAPFLSRRDGTRIAFCAGPELDVMRGRSFGVNVPGEGTKTWVSAVVGVEGAVPVSGPWRLSVGVAVVLPQHREHFALQGIGEVHQPASVAGRAALGLELTF
jgi:hypothetical protein